MYDANFTAGGLLYYEFIKLEPILLGNSVVKDIKEEAEKNQLMGVKTHSARKRILSEIERRFKNMPLNFWNWFYALQETEQKLALFYVCLKTYKVVFDIHWEVTLKKFVTTGILDPFDIQMFIDELQSKDENVATWKETTQKKINVQYRKALADCKLLKGQNLSSPVNISTDFWVFFSELNDQWFKKACFLA